MNDPEPGRVSGSATLSGMRWPDLAGGAVTTLLVPVGSIEQHGPHLPLDTDTRIAVAVAEAAARRLGDGVVVAPAVAFGASGEHEAFPGTVSIGTEALRSLLVELGRSAGRWARRLVFVNGHGGNLDAVRAAVALLVEEGRDARWYGCAPPPGSAFPGLDATDAGPRPVDAHAGHTETSIMLALAPETVHLDRAEPGNPAPLSELLPALRTGGVRAASANGVLGDPTGADPVRGSAMLHAMARACAARASDPGR